MSRIRKILLLVIVILLVISFSLAISYGYYQHSATNSPSQVVTTIGGMDSLVLENETMISLTGDQSAPISDKKALSSDLYKMTFDVINNSSKLINFDLGLIPLSSTTMSISCIKYAIYKVGSKKPSQGKFLSTTPVTLSNDLKAEINNQYNESPTTGYLINESESILAGQTITYNLYVWLDYYEGGVNNSQMNKTFEGIVAIIFEEDYDRAGLYALLDEKKANITTLSKLSTYQNNTIIDLIRKQNVDVNNVKYVYAVDLKKAQPDITNNMAFFADVDNEDVIASWVEGNNLFIGERNEVRPGPSMFTAFSNTNQTNRSVETFLKSIDFGNHFNTSKVTNMYEMFYDFCYEGSEFNLNLGPHFNTSNVTNMSRMFSFAGYNSTSFTLNLTNFNTSNVTTMWGMFSNAGFSSNTFSLNLGLDFYTPNVTNMSHMFSYTGYSSNVFTLNLGSKFNTSNVISMYYMFSYTGYSSNVFTLDLGPQFNTINVRYMSHMFSNTGYSSNEFILNLGTHFDTSKVTDMSSMFSNTGYSSNLFTLNLGPKFNTSNVTTMTGMFYQTGYSSPVFTLNLGSNFDTQK